MVVVPGNGVARISFSWKFCTLYGCLSSIKKKVSKIFYAIQAT